MTPEQFVGAIQALSFDNVFNPYSDQCPVYDLSDAPLLRSGALLAMLRAATTTEIDAVWIGRDLGHRGGRRTGLALTDDVHLRTHATRWNIAVERATIGSMVAERTAAVIWSMLGLVSATVFLWNVFPLHPHEPDEPFSNRAHSRHERMIGEEIMAELILMLRPRRVVAIGNDAGQAAARLARGADALRVRHPSYGGQREFMGQIRCIYDLKPDAKQLAFS